jgi:hypothetical protein
MAQGIDGNPEVRVAGPREGKRTGQNADDGLGLVVEVERLPHRIAPSAEAMKPCSITQDHNIWPTRPILAGIKVASEHGMHAERLEEAAAHAFALDRHRTGRSA